MNSNNTPNEEIVDDISSDGVESSVDDFIKELELKERDLHISSDMVIEIGDSEVEHENIHDSFVKNLNSEIPHKKTANQPQSTSVSESKSSKEFVSNLKGNVEKLTNERDDLKASLGRRQRDFDNYRNRIERERKDTYKNILGNLATKILPVLDNLHRALELSAKTEKNTGEQDLRTFFDGIVLVNQQLNEVLMEMGVKPIPAVGEAFDPNIHEAVATEKTDKYPNNTVIQELLRGYQIDEKVIRASMVKVSSFVPPQQKEIKLDLDLDLDLD
jgi:molecular chaperone GrpE